MTKQEPIERLVIVQESGIQLFCGRYENHIHCFIPHNDETFGKQFCAQLNRKTDLPFYLTKVKVQIIQPFEKWTDEKLKENGIEPLKKEEDERKSESVR